MTNRHITTVAAILAALSAAPVYAQTAPTPPFGTTAGQTTAPATTAPAARSAAPTTGTVSDLTSFQLTKPLNLFEQGSAEAKLNELLKSPELQGLPLNRVRIVGVPDARPNTAGSAYVTINWKSVTLDDNSKQAQIPGNVTTTLQSDSPIIPKSQDVRAKGDVSGLITAVKNLFGAQAAAAAAGPAADNPPKDAGAKSTAAPAGTGGAAASPTGSSPPPVNTGNYKPVEYQASTATDTPAPTTSVSTEVCTAPRVDWSNNQVFTQSRTVTTTNGSPSKGQCTDASMPIPIQWDYAVCGAPVPDTSSMTVTVYRRPYYNDPNTGTSQFLGACAKDPNKTFAITADYANCPVFQDTAKGTVAREAELVWIDDTGKRNVAAACAVLTGEATFNIVKTTDGCSIRNDFQAGKSYQQERSYYMINGQEQPLKACADTATTYSMVPDTTLCKPYADTAAKKYYTMAMLRIDTPNGSQYLTQCQPTDAGAAITETTAGCETLHDDDFTAGQSTLYSKWIKADGTTVQACGPSATTATHQYVTQGYDNDDAKKTSTEKLAVYITLPAPLGYTMISGAQIRTQSRVTPYTLVGDVTTPTGVTFQQGCTTYQETEINRQYTRADGSTYLYYISAGTATAQPGTALYGGTHTDTNCCVVGGTTVDIGSGQKLCKKSGSSCPSGWAQHLNWSTTQNVSGSICGWRDGITGECYSWSGGSYSTGSHAFSNLAVERTTGDGGSTVYASVIEVGCK